MNFIILGDKYNRGTKSKGCSGLMPHKKDTIIKNQTSTIFSVFPRSKIIYVYGYDQKKIENYAALNYKSKKNIEFIHNPEYLTKGFGRSLFTALDYLNDSCVIMFGNTIITKSILMKIKHKVPQVFLSKTIEYKLGCVITDEYIENMSYGLTNYSYGIYHFPKPETAMVAGVLDSQAGKNMFVFEIVNLLIENKVRFESCFIRKQNKE